MEHNHYVSIIVPNFNGAEYLPRCIQSVLRAFEVYSGDHELIVVDDGSSDDSVAILRGQFPLVQVIELGRNTGFGAACNVGVWRAKNDIALLLNSDTYVDENFLSPLLSHFSGDEGLFGVGCKMMSWDTLTHQLGRMYGAMKHGIVDAVHEKDNGLTSACETCFLCAGACAICKDKYLALGGIARLHRRSDIDLSYRARKRGWNILYDPRSIVYHKGMGTDRKIWNKRQIHTMKCKERLLLNWRNLTDTALLLKHIASLPLLPFHWGARTTVIAFCQALLRLPEVLRFRRSERAHIVLSDTQVLAAGQTSHHCVATGRIQRR